MADEEPVDEDGVDEDGVEGESLDDDDSLALAEKRDDERPAPGTHDVGPERREVGPRR